MGEHAKTHCATRLNKVIEGEQGGISKAVSWQGGGGFRFYQLSTPIFDEYGSIHADVRFSALAAHVWFAETRTPLRQPEPSPLLGVSNDCAYYLLYNGILGDKRPDGGNVLTNKLLNSLPDLDKHTGKKIIVYGEASRLGEARLKSLNISFRHIPYDVNAS
jgi:adenine-specific DNA-methyltransferase